MVIQDIQEVKQYLEMKFKVSLQWLDARLAFYNIKHDEKMNSLSLDEQLSLWTPTIVFWNTKNQLRTLNDENTFASVKREQNGSTLSMCRVYSIQFFCDYDMAWYPFDQQTCKVEMVLDGVLDNYIDLLPGGVKFSGPTELTQYYVKTFRMDKNKIFKKGAIVVYVTLGRRLLGTFLTVFFPTILLNVIGYATNFFKQFFFEVKR